MKSPLHRLIPFLPSPELDPIPPRLLHFTFTVLYYSVASESESYVKTDGQPASLTWSKAPIWGLRPGLYYLCDSCGLVLVGRPL
jgi:hypothetical protein